PDLQKAVRSLIQTLADIASAHTETLLSGYTHLQRAQPVTLAHHLCAWAWPLVRDCERLSDSLGRIAKSPLGSGALAGSDLPLDREFVAETLGFDGVTENSLDGVSDRDYCIEFAADFALLQMHLSRMSEEIVLWATAEFGFVDLSEKWSTGSSIMPQKKNPDFAELIRGRTGKVYGDLVSLLVMMKGLPLAYDKDMQEDKQSLFEAYDTVRDNVVVFEAMIATARWNTRRMAASCDGGFANATDVADYLVRKGLPFRTAHGVAAQAVRLCIARGLGAIEELPLADLQAISPLFGEDIFAQITPRACVEARSVTGGPAKARVEAQIAALRAFAAAE
ncbi:MAG: argininosuccinate lyase, partial [Treponemataceae bacterium]|nr:argininosuccinate lyase [Treponemataceae bacterium]